jgi:hypothetical protein
MMLGMARDERFIWPKNRVAAPTRASPSADPTQQIEPQARVLEKKFRLRRSPLGLEKAGY